MKKTIAIISPDAISPSPSTALGNRITQLATAFQLLNYTVTIYLPKINYDENVTYSFDIKSYNYGLLDCEELPELLHNDFILLPSNLTLLERYESKLFGHKSKIILDGWVPLLAEYTEILKYKDWPLELKVDKWMSTKELYFQFIQHADLILCANDTQKTYYQCILQALDYENIFISSKVYKLPYALTNPATLHKALPSDRIKLIWYGVLYPWYDLVAVLEVVKKYPFIQLDCYGLKHPRYNGYYMSIKDSLKKYTKYHNITINEQFSTEDPITLFNQYDAAIMFSQETIENQLSHRTRIFDMLKYGLPILTNCGHIITKEYATVAPLIYTLDLNSLKDSLDPMVLAAYLHNTANLKTKKKVEEFLEALSIESITKSLSNILSSEKI